MAKTIKVLWYAKWQITEVTCMTCQLVHDSRKITASHFKLIYTILPKQLEQEVGSTVFEKRMETG